jgi:hypothetical protein
MLYIHLLSIVVEINDNNWQSIYYDGVSYTVMYKTSYFVYIYRQIRIPDETRVSQGDLLPRKSA